MVNMLFDNDDDVIAGWDLAIPIVGAAAALFTSVYLYVTRRARAMREQRFGDSLRDQLGRHIAQLDDEATRGTGLMTMLLIPMLISAVALYVAGTRVNLEPNEPFDGWPAIIRITVFFAIVWLAGRWAARRSVKRDVLPRKHRLEALLKELDG
jgi:hypothetical protein